MNDINVMKEHLLSHILYFFCRVEAIYPVHDPLALQDTRVHSLVQYAMKVRLHIVILQCLIKLMYNFLCVIVVSIG